MIVCLYKIWFFKK